MVLVGLVTLTLPGGLLALAVDGQAANGDDNTHNVLHQLLSERCMRSAVSGAVEVWGHWAHRQGMGFVADIWPHCLWLCHSGITGPL